MPSKILIVEDEPALQDTLEYNLIRDGYEVRLVGDGAKAVEIARGFQPDIVLLDVMLPGIDGFEVCRILRQETNVPILFLTTRDAENDRINGLEIGADDYLTKPFSVRELQARVRALLRRVRLDQQELSQVDELAGGSEILSFGDLNLDQARHEVTLDGRPVRLKPKEYELFLFLARHQGQVLSRDLILETVWGWDFIGGSRTVDVHIRWLREKIEPEPARPIRIVTVRGAGYRFEG